MINPSVIDAILAINPSAHCKVTEEDLDRIEWYETTPISKSDIEAKLTELKKTYADLEYQRDREPAYPEIKEQLDLLYHDMTSGKGDKTGEWYKAIKKVKDDNPKG